MTKEELLNKILGCLVGGGIGDALGYPVEFMRYNQILAKYGQNGITRYELNYKGIAVISDDTQMSLYTANGLLINDIKEAYIEWFKTQTQRHELISEPKCWLSKIPEMYSQRAPGTTCMTALQNLMFGQETPNNSKGCGGIMRVAPIALWGYVNSCTLDEVIEKSCYAARLTHQHPLGFLSAGLFAAVLYQILAKEQTITANTIFDYVIDSLKILSNLKAENGTQYKQLYYDDLVALRVGSSEALWKARQTENDDITNIERLGQGWTGEEAWFISLYCTLKHLDSFEDAVVASVNHGGDSDSTGAITGNLMGVIHGYSAIPNCYKDCLELREIIEKMADELCNSKISS